MYCMKCGAQNTDDARFCIKCGAQMPTLATAPLPPPRRRRLPVWLLIPVASIAAVVIVTLVVLAALGNRSNGTLPTPLSSIVIAAQTEAVGPTVTLTPLPSSIPPSDTPSLTPTATSSATPTPSSTSTPSPSPTPTQTATPIPSFTPTPSDTPTSTVTPKPKNTPKPKCRNAMKGMIAFKRQKRCDKKTGNACGPVEIWVMNADGSNQAPMCNPNAYTWGFLRDRTSNDDQWRLEVSSQKPDIIRVYTNGQWEWIIVNNRKDWDPVLSADNWWLAWVTNRNANDEIYIKTMDPKDQNQRRLTMNEWEWDKHPTWSPDGHKIAFYSNRADKLNEATRQIWVMEVVNDQGVNLRNLSQRPDQVDTNPVWFKWDDIPH